MTFQKPHIYRDIRSLFGKRGEVKDRVAMSRLVFQGTRPLSSGSPKHTEPWNNCADSWK